MGTKGQSRTAIISVSIVIGLTCTIVYGLRTQNLNFVAPIPEQLGTTTMHFPEVSGDTYWLSGGFIEMHCGGF